MPWLAYKNQVTGMLYYDTLQAFTNFTDAGGATGGNPWVSQYLFGGNGDGTLFYPGTPAKAGGTTDIPVASLRLKMIREGLEDYEYMKKLGSNRLAWTKAQIASVFPNAWETHDIGAEGHLFAARHAMACQIEADMQINDPDCVSSPPACQQPTPDNCSGTCVDLQTDAFHCGASL